ncbi:MAG: response regulator [gamma proteobacterium symbiont of Bathyaustriella thionipta]|nr:response regulator [gamma proteobacterium symbiont of Bathyaustriella thionipta]
MASRLLIVEDDHALRQMLSWSLEDLGYKVSSTSSCAGANTLAGEQHFDAALLDYHLPDGDGVQLSSELRKRFPHINIIICSGAAHSQPLNFFTDAGARQFVSKPVSAERIHQLLSALVPTHKELR